MGAPASEVPEIRREAPAYAWKALEIVVVDYPMRHNPSRQAALPDPPELP